MQNDHKEVQPMKRKNRKRKCKKRHHKKFENNNSQKETKVVKLKEMLTAAFKIHDVQFFLLVKSKLLFVFMYILKISHWALMATNWKFGGSISQ